MLCRICMFVFAPQPDHLVDALHLRQEGQEQEGWAQRVAGMARSNSRPTDTGLIDRFSVATAACGADSIAHPASATARYKMQEGKLSLTPRKKKMAALSLLLITIAYVGVGILPSEQDQGRLSPPRLSPPWSPSTPPPRRT